MSEKPDPPWLIALGSDVSEGRAVDWERMERQAADHETRALVHSLRQIATVVDAQRSGDTEAGASNAAGSTAVTSHWRQLVLYEPVGSGAFGTVFRAWDTQLDREVAFKRLSRPPIADESPLAEARHLARVRHPNVVTVYGAEQEEEHVGIWMELIQGDTLAAMVQQRGPMSAREGAGIGIDLCRALSALHGAALLHRDVKAHNVMREVGGRIVLMDFSGVRGLEETERPGDLSGTPLYMAPELFGDGRATVATDIYSLGVLLFYLLSGRYPVEGATLAAIRRQHRSHVRTRLRDLRPELPDAVVQVVERACAPAAGDRYATAGELEHALVGTLGTHVTPAADTPPRSFLGLGGAPGRRAKQTAMLGAAALVTSALLVATAWQLRHRAPEPLDIRLKIGPPYNTVSWPRISPDGRLVLFGTTIEGKAGASHETLWVHPLGAFEGHPLLEATVRETAFWSANSREVGFFADGKLKKVGVDGGGKPVTLADAPHARGGDWSRQGTILFATDTGLHRVSADGRVKAQVTSLDASLGELQHAWPEFLPDGRRFLYIVRSAQPEQSGLYLGSLDGPRRTRVMPAFSRAVYSPTGHVLFVRDGTLVAQRFDQRSEQLTGEPVAIAPSAKYHPAGDAAFDVSQNGVLIYRLSESPASMRLVRYDRSGTPRRVVAPDGFYRHPRLSPDDRRIVVEKIEPGASNPDLWLFETDGDRASKFTSTEAPEVRPAWSPDGRHIVFSSKRGAQFDVYSKTVDGTDPERLMDSSPGDKFVECWTANGSAVVMTVRLLTIPRTSLWIVPLAKGARRTLVRESSAVEDWQAQVSRDGRWIAYVSTADSGTPEVWVEPLPGTGARWQVSAHGGSDPQWRDDGRELVYLAPDGMLMSVQPSSGQQWTGGVLARMFQVSVPEPLGPSDLTLAPDGASLIVNTLVGGSLVPPVHVVTNWTRLIRR